MELLIAWLGVILALAALAWNVVAHFRDAPKIKVRTKRHVSYFDARVIATTTTEEGEVKELASYNHVEIVNIGKQPTTITRIEAAHSARKDGAEMSYSQDVIPLHHGRKLPVLLGPGEMCSCRIEESHIENLASRGDPELRIYCSHLDDPIIERLGT